MASVTFTIEHRPVLVASDGRVFTDVASAYHAYVDPMQHLLSAVDRVSHETREEPEKEEEQKREDQEREEPETKEDQEDQLVGKRVAVYWNGNKREFAGTVTRVDAGSVFVAYDDGDEGWEDSWRVLQPCTRTPGCPKEAKHCGPCPGKKRKCVVMKRTRPPVQRLGHADGWGKGAARRWVSNA